MKLAQHMMEDPSLPLEAYSLRLNQEQTNLVEQWNATGTNIANDKCIHEVFEEKAKQTPDAVAVMFEDRSLTYKEVDEKAHLWQSTFNIRVLDLNSPLAFVQSVRLI